VSRVDKGHVRLYSSEQPCLHAVDVLHADSCCTCDIVCRSNQTECWRWMCGATGY